MKPWSEIETPDNSSSHTAILADPEHPFDFYWGRNFDGQYVFRFMGDFPPEICEEAPVMSGIKTSSGTEGGRTHLTLALESVESAEIFYFLCKSLMEATKIIKEGSDTAAARVVFTHLGRWQKLLEKRGAGLLTLQQQMGLFGELLVLKNIFLENLEASEAVSCWTGPMGDEQDFGYGNSLIEVKTVRSTRDTEIKISSIAQLDPVSGKISLVFQTLGVFEEQPPEALSLNGMVNRITGILLEHGVDVQEQFAMRLAMLNYENHPAYDKHFFAPVARKIFAVEGDFPRIGSADIRQGISKASYSILVDSCLPFELEMESAMNRIMDGVESAKLNEVDIPPETLIKLDESRNLEFKSSLRYCYREEKAEKSVEQVIIKTVVALANTVGGKLVIGVDDDNNILGLENDFKTLRQPDRDGFELYLSTLLVNACGEAFTAQFVETVFHSINGLEICIVSVRKSEELRFVEVVNKAGVKTKKLYARIGNSSREVPPDRIPEYIDNRIN